MPELREELIAFHRNANANKPNYKGVISSKCMHRAFLNEFENL